MQFPAEHRASPVGIEYVEVAGDKAAMAEWIGPGWEDLPLRCVPDQPCASKSVL